jgi:hypothetical protein
MKSPFSLKILVISLLTGLFIVFASVQDGFSDQITIKNEMTNNIKPVLCVDEKGNSSPAIGSIKAGASLTVPSDKFPETNCSRLAVFIADDKGWQFYHQSVQSASLSGATEIVFSADKPNLATGDYPSLLLDYPGDTYVFSAGIPLSTLTNQILAGLNETKWKEITTPGLDPKKNTDFLVAFADQSWNVLKKDGLVFSELTPGQQLLAKVSLETEFSNPVIFAIFEGLKELECSPTVLKLNGSTETLDISAPGPTRWEALDQFMLKVVESGGGQAHLSFSSENLNFNLELELDKAKAILEISRNENAGLG